MDFSWSGASLQALQERDFSDFLPGGWALKTLKMVKSFLLLGIAGFDRDFLVIKIVKKSAKQYQFR